MIEISDKVRTAVGLGDKDEIAKDEVPLGSDPSDEEPISLDD
jgi:hypothetical protein